MTDELAAAAVLGNEPKGPQFAPKELIEMIAEMGVPYSTALARMKIFAMKQLIHGRVSNRTSVYEFPDAGAACVLSQLLEIGLQDHRMLRAVREGLYGWGESAAERNAKYVAPGSEYLPSVGPIGRAVIGSGRGEYWNLHMICWRDRDTRELAIGCDVTVEGDPVIFATPEGDPIRTSTMTLPLLLGPVIRRLDKWRPGT